MLISNTVHIDGLEVVQVLAVLKSLSMWRIETLGIVGQ